MQLLIIDDCELISDVLMKEELGQQLVVWWSSIIIVHWSKIFKRYNNRLWMMTINYRGQMKKIFLGQIKTFVRQSTHKMANLNRHEIWAVLCSKRKYKQLDGEKWLCEILHIVGLLNSENPIQIQTQTFIKHVLPVVVRAINHLKNKNHRTRKRQEWGGGGLIKHFCVSTRSRMRHPLYDDQ